MKHLQVDNKHYEEQIEEKDAKIAKLERELAALRPPPPTPAPAPAPAPAPKAAPPPKNQHEVAKGAATGAATGAVKGAIGKCFACICAVTSDPYLTYKLSVFLLAELVLRHALPIVGAIIPGMDASDGAKAGAAAGAAGGAMGGMRHKRGLRR
jgi:hypothetical protein